MRTGITLGVCICLLVTKVTVRSLLGGTLGVVVVNKTGEIIQCKWFGGYRPTLR